MAQFAIPLMAVGAGLQAFGTFSKGRNDAKALQAQAAEAARQGYADEQTQRRQARQMLGEQAAAFAQSGSGVGGTAQLLMKQSSVLAELDALNIRDKGVRERAGLLAQAKAVKRDSTLMAGAQLLSGATRIASARGIG